MKTIADILNTLDSFEYNSFGSVKRYPDEKEYEEAINLLRGLFDNTKNADVFVITRQELDALKERINGW